MITEIVTLRLPGILAREDILERFDASARVWADNPDLIRKNYLLDIENGIVGGIYFWKTRQAAEKWHGPAFREQARQVYGAEPNIRLFDTPIVVDNVTGTVVRN